MEDTTVMEPKLAWSGRVLWPHWIFQILTTGAVTGIYFYVLIEYGIQGSWDSWNHHSFMFASCIIFFILDILAIVMVAHQIHRYRENNLSAKTMLRSQVILQVFTWIHFLIQLLGVLDILPGGNKTWPDFYDFYLVVTATAFFLGTFIYTLVIRRRRQKARRETMGSFGMNSYGGSKHGLEDQSIE